jgi:serine/threonine protein kinase
VAPETHFKNFDKSGLDLLMKMLQLDPARRISMKEALRHPYFSDLKQEDMDKYKV